MNFIEGVVIGYDGRHNSQRYARHSANTFLSKGFKVYLFNRMVATPHVVCTKIFFFLVHEFYFLF